MNDKNIINRTTIIYRKDRKGVIMTEHNHNNVDKVYTEAAVRDGESVEYTSTTTYGGVVKEDKAGANISWSAVIAGAITFIALSILLSLIGSAIGFGVPNFTANEPFAGLTVSMVIWFVVSLIVSLGGAGYVAGVAAGRGGLVHGFLTWAVSLFLSTWLAFSALSGVFGLVGNVVGGTLGAAGNAVSTVATTAGDAIGSIASTAGSAVGNLTQEAFDSIAAEINIEDTADVEEEVLKALENSDVPQFQPNFLQSQIDLTIDEIKDAGRRIVIDGEDAQAVVSEVGQSIEDRITDIAADVDRDDLEKVISENTDLSKQEVEKAVDNLIESYNESAEKVQTALADADTRLQELSTQASEKAEEVSEQADEIVSQAVEVSEDVSNEVSKYSLYLFLGLVLGCVFTTMMGKAGVKSSDKYFEIVNK